VWKDSLLDAGIIRWRVMIKACEVKGAKIVETEDGNPRSNPSVNGLKEKRRGPRCVKSSTNLSMESSMWQRTKLRMGGMIGEKTGGRSGGVDGPVNAI